MWSLEGLLTDDHLSLPKPASSFQGLRIDKMPYGSQGLDVIWLSRWSNPLRECKLPSAPGSRQKAEFRVEVLRGIKSLFHLFISPTSPFPSPLSFQPLSLEEQILGAVQSDLRGLTFPAPLLELVLLGVWVLGTFHCFLDSMFFVLYSSFFTRSFPSALITSCANSPQGALNAFLISFLLTLYTSDLGWGSGLPSTF